MTTDTDDIDPVARIIEDNERRLLEQMEVQRRWAFPEDYVYDKAQGAFWDIEDNTLHDEKQVDASIPQERWRVVVQEAPEPVPGEPPRRGRRAGRRETLIRPSQDIMRVETDQFVEGSTWWPGQPKIIHDWFIDKDGFFKAPGRRSFNQYRPPPELNGNADDAGMWIEHVKKLWPEPKEHEFFFDYCAHMVQAPDEKCNAAIVLSGEQGIGKDAALLAVKDVVGEWNTKGIDPNQLFSPYQPWLQTLMLTIDEARPSKDDFQASSMYNIMKPLIAAPPMTLPLNDKYQKLRYIINVLRVFITTNDWMAMYIPAEDRRMFVMHSTLKQKWHLEAGDPGYFRRYFTWLRDRGGAAAVAAWLRARDLSAFDPKQQIERTAGWEAVAVSWSAPDDGVTAALERLDRPDVVFGQELLDFAFDDRAELTALMKSPRKIAHRMQWEGYLLKKCPTGERWSFRVDGRLFRSRLAFVRQDYMRDAAMADAAIQERGKRLAAAAASAATVTELPQRPERRI